MKSHNLVCNLCQQGNVKNIYFGDIRDGVYGNYCKDGIIYRCNSCNIEYLDEKFCIPDEYYETEKYRKILNQKLDSSNAYKDQDWTTKYIHELISPETIRNKIVVDVGSGIGSFLDSCHSIPSKTIAIEPCIPYHKNLEKNHFVFKNINDAVIKFKKQVDLIVSVQVIEHVKNPIMFLKSFKPMMNVNCQIYITTPNRNEILMKIIPEDYKKFFYRKVHRWYFDKKSLEFCARKAGFKIEKTGTYHKYGINNTIMWLKNKKPYGMKKSKIFDYFVDDFWKNYLIQKNLGDTLWIKLKKLS